MARPSASQERYVLTPLGQQMVAENLGLPYYLCGRYPSRRRRSDPDERLSAAILGLVKAVACFVPGRAKFATYATHVMLKEISRAERRDTTIRTPHETARRYEATAARALAITSIAPEAHGGLGIQVVDHRPTEEEIEEAEREHADRLERLRELIPELSEGQRQVMTRVARGECYAEIARVLGISREAVRQRAERGRQTLLRGMTRRDHDPVSWGGSLVVRGTS